MVDGVPVLTVRFPVTKRFRLMFALGIFSTYTYLHVNTLKIKIFRIAVVIIVRRRDGGPREGRGERLVSLVTKRRYHGQFSTQQADRRRRREVSKRPRVFYVIV